MNKATLSLKLAEKLDLSKKTAEDFLEALEDLITKTLMSDEEVTLAGFGTFSSRVRKARKGVHPRNPSQSIDVPTVRVAKFKTGSALKKALKESV